MSNKILIGVRMPMAVTKKQYHSAGTTYFIGENVTMLIPPDFEAQFLAIGTAVEIKPEERK